MRKGRVVSNTFLALLNFFPLLVVGRAEELGQFAWGRIRRRCVVAGALK